MMNNPIIFIHGSGDSARIWRLQMEELGKVGRVFAIDLPGHGERLNTMPDRVTVLDYARAAHQITQDELHLDHPIIAGHSLGGAIALTMALEYGSELGGLILVGTGARLRVLPEVLEASRSTPQEVRDHLFKVNVIEANRATIAPMIKQEQIEPGPTILHRDLMACNVFDCMDRLAEISLPTLIICGANDSATPVKYSQFLHSHLKRSTLRIIPNAAHYVMREQPEEVNEAIREWWETI
jgi:pimeloyl-ACP methyl ester carboxylesterase